MTTVFFLADLNVIKPDPGLILWTSVIFIIVYYFLSRFAFRPIQEALKQRERDIQSSLDEAKRAREEMAHLKAKNEELLKQAQEERSMILREAKEAKESIIAEAKNKAKEEARKILTAAREEIGNMRNEAMYDLKNQVGIMALDISEKVLQENLKGDAAQEKLVNTLVGQMNIRLI